MKIKANNTHVLYNLWTKSMVKSSYKGGVATVHESILFPCMQRARVRMQYVLWVQLMCYFI